MLTIWYDDTLFGENWNDDSIDLKTRCIITVVALMSSRMTDKSLNKRASIITLQLFMWLA